MCSKEEKALDWSSNFILSLMALNHIVSSVNMWVECVSLWTQHSEVNNVSLFCKNLLDAGLLQTQYLHSPVKQGAAVLVSRLTYLTKYEKQTSLM